MDDNEQIAFEGKDGTEAENFVRNVKARAFKLGKQKDNSWMAAFASICFAGNALRWFESLDDETQSDWKLLRSAILAKYPAGSGEGSPSSLRLSTRPSLMASSSSQPRGRVSSRSEASASPPPRPMGPRGSLPTTTLADGPPAYSLQRTSSLSSTAPSPSTVGTPAAGPPVASGPGVPAFIAARLTQRARDSMNVPKRRGRIRVTRNGSSGNEYVSRGVTTRYGPTECRGYHFVVTTVSDALEVEYSPSTKPHGFMNLNSTTNRAMLGFTWFEKSPLYLGSQQGDLGYAHLVDASRDGYDEEQTSLDWSGVLPNINDWDDLAKYTETDVWRIGVDGAIHASWTGPSGKIYSLWPVVRGIDGEVLLVVDYDMFLAAHDGQGYSQARLVFEEV